MDPVEISTVDKPDDVTGLAELVEACTKADGHAPLGEHSLLAAVRPGAAGHAGFAVRRDGQLTGYLHLSELNAGEGWSIEMAVHPTARGREIGTALLTAAVEHISKDHGGGAVNLWVYGDSAPARALARRLGFVPARELLQLRLPTLPEEAPEPPTGVVMSTFQPEDTEEWLTVNNRAFAWHPENGGWTKDDLEVRMATPWWDPAGFLIARHHGAMVGFCWTKLHDGKVGEIYVVGADPDHQGKGLGRFLTLAGLASLRQRGAETGMLYVEADNTAARRLYRDLGFVHHHTDTCWRRQVA